MSARIETQEWPPWQPVIDTMMHIGSSQQGLSLGMGREPTGTNPPFRTPLGMWFTRSEVEDLITDILNGEHIDSLTVTERVEMQRDLEDSRNTPVPTSRPLKDIFSRLLDKVDGLLARDNAGLGASVGAGGFIVQRATSELGAATELLTDPSSSLEECFCGPDAGLAEKLYDGYIRLAAVFRGDRWHSEAGIEDLHKAAQDMLHKLQSENRRIMFSTSNSRFWNHFREQVDIIEGLLELHLPRMLDNEADGKRAGLGDAKTTFAHIAALKHAYENNADPICAPMVRNSTTLSSDGALRETLVITKYVRHPRFANHSLPGRNLRMVSDDDDLRPVFWRSAKPQQRGPSAVGESLKKEVRFSDYIARIPVTVPKPETAATPLDPLLTPNVDGSTGGDEKSRVLTMAANQSDNPNSVMDVKDANLKKSPLSSSRTNAQGLPLAHAHDQGLATCGSPSPDFSREDIEQTNPGIASGTNDYRNSTSQTRDVGSLFDTRSSDIGGYAAAMTREWLKSYTSRTQTLLEARRRQGDPRVRIAVLDTGIDLEHPKLSRSKARIMDCRSWVADDPSIGDVCGHGTHIASVLLKMAPWAHLYVARVFKDGDDVSDSGVAAIVEAIHHARVEWKVDVLSLSFGYRKYKPQIEAAIKACVEASPPILVFAAAANTGAREDRPSFPARMTGVFCVNSASGDGQPSTYNPPMGPRDDNLTFLGEAIPGAWPAVLGGGAPSRTLSGTSFAVPVAVSIAALVLEFCRQRPPLAELSEQCVARIRTYEGMREVFRETMAGRDVDKHMLIQPWRLFDAREEERDLEKQRVAAASKLSAAILNAFGE
ncbi:hypothetical protein F5Y14DRAFT_328140 [Nemania sp. NC0429]|nr:hypothetical protein F5Y14DRAFT_328140 [Nemania sp. NC0429]